MAAIPVDPLFGLGIAGFGQRLRSGQISAEAVTRTYLQRIAVLESALGAFEYVATDRALDEARAIDCAIASGTDLGPLMGVPVAVKDLIAVDGMPTLAGSNVDVRDVIGDQGSFVASLKRAGCIIIGKTKTPEFARSGVGINLIRGTPWNPWDASVKRVPGGSSSGSAVAVAAGLCAFAVGTDTSGSVRIPAAFCGVFGFKPTKGLWSNDGVFSLSPTLDTIGLLTASAADAALVFAAIQGQSVPQRCSTRGLRLGLPVNHFFDNLAETVAVSISAVLAILQEAGVELVPVEFPKEVESDRRFRPLVAAELIGVLGRERFLAARGTMDPDVWKRTALGLDIRSDELARLRSRHFQLRRVGQQLMVGLDGWITPTTQLTPVPTNVLIGTSEGDSFTADVGRNTWPSSLYGLCATSTPIQVGNLTVPVGMQIICPAKKEAELLSIALALEELVGLPLKPNVEPFLQGAGSKSNLPEG